MMNGRGRRSGAGGEAHRVGIMVVMVAAHAVGSGAVAAQEEAGPERITLEAAVRSALGTSPALAAARSRVEAAEAGVGTARAAWLPTVAAQGMATHYEEPMVVAPLHGFDPMNPPAFERTLIQGHGTAEWTAFDGGARGARFASARELETAAAAGVDAAEAAVIAEAVAAYVTLGTALELVTAHERLVRAMETERSRAALLLEEGRVPRVAVLRAEAALSRARADLEGSREGAGLAARRLARVTGLDAATLETGVVALEAAPAPGDRSGLVAAALAANPQVAGSRARAAAAEAMVGAARSAYLPRVAVAGRYSAFGSTESSLEPEWNAGVQVSWPVFTGGARARSAERAAAEAKAARGEAAVVAREVEDAVDAAWAAYRSARARAAALETAVAQSEEVARIESLALEAGAGLQTDYLRAEADLLQVRAVLAEVRGAALEARVRLAQATGSLTVESLSELTREVAR